jgi:hypothetical protein
VDTFRYVVIGVFTDTPLTGNQLGVFTDAREIPEDMLDRGNDDATTSNARWLSERLPAAISLAARHMISSKFASG